MLPWGTTLHADSSYCQSLLNVEAGGVSRTSCSASKDHTFSIGDRAGEQAFQGSNTISGVKKNFRIMSVMYGRVLSGWNIVECMGGPWASESQTCSAGCSVYRLWLLDGCGSGFQ
ncbi:hypothetical protein TNCV_652801 [Trichonephila clavipes]|nr:hypothetical protein TNCV_652801 [Trichonephila clavipes]